MTKCVLNLPEQDQTKLTFESISILTPYLTDKGNVVMKVPLNICLVFTQCGSVAWSSSPSNYNIIRPLTKEESVTIYGVK